MARFRVCLRRSITLYPGNRSDVLMKAPAARGTRLGEAFLEAGQRTQDAAAEFWEWLRLGR